MGLTDMGNAVCETIVAAPEAWLPWGDLETRFGAAELETLVSAGVLEKWARPDYLAVTLTPWAAEVMGVEIDELYRPATEVREERDERRPLSPPEKHAERVMVETPVWRWRGHKVRPILIPRHARIGTTLVGAARVAAPEPAEEVLRDEYGEEVRIAGLPVRIDRRMRGKR